jgi:DNA modification methylase
MVETGKIEQKNLVSRLSDPEMIRIDKIICKEIDDLTQENNQIWTSPDHDKREYVHSFFQYPAMMVPVVQKRLIEIITTNKTGIKAVLDPFMGSGTSLVACMENKLDCFGQDINPLAVLVAKARTGPFYFNAIQKKKIELFQRIEEDRSSRIETNFKGLNKWFKKKVIIELSKIVRAIRAERMLSIRRFYWVILAETVRLTSNDRTSTFKLHIRTKSNIKERKISPIEFFGRHFENCLDDIKSYAHLLSASGNLLKGAYTGNITISLADSKDQIARPKQEKNTFDLLVTSPPYGDNKTTVTYGQHSYLPLQWIDLQDIDEKASEEFLSTTSEIDTRGLGGKIKKLTDFELQILFDASPSLEKLYTQLTVTDSQKLKKVINYFRDIYQSIRSIHQALAMDSYQVWTVGNRTVGGVEIPNNLILSEFIQRQGSTLVKVISREILCRRMATRNSSGSLMTYEDILIFRKIKE